MTRGRLSCAAAFGATALLLTGPTGATAHERKTIGPIRLTIGWGEEPAFSGFKNFAEVDVADEAGAPIADIAGALTVEVGFGGQRITLPLVAARERPGKLRALLVPTRPGTYTFHITGSVRGQAIDTTSTCSDATFACIVDASAVQFPAKDPSAGQLAERVSRTLPRAEQALDTAAQARLIGIAAMIAAILACAAAFGPGGRRGRKGV